MRLYYTLKNLYYLIKYLKLKNKTMSNESEELLNKKKPKIKRVKIFHLIIKILYRKLIILITGKEIIFSFLEKE